ncbi:hypothetical protein NL676_028121 [Syzygium grande]|nr:hypothetical protein NL676_028121 [Syzygium grande]
MLLTEIEYLQKREIELENESVFLRTKIAEVERIQQGNMVAGPQLNAMEALASRNFFPPNMIEGGTTYSPSNKKVLHLGNVCVRTHFYYDRTEAALPYLFVLGTIAMTMLLCDHVVMQLSLRGIW